MDLDVNFPRADDEELILPQADAFPPMAPQALGGAPPQDESSPEAAVVLQQRKRREPKVLPVDQTQELRNTDLAEWNNNYIANMDNAKNAKIQHKASAKAKQDAAFWVFGAGIGGIGAGMGASGVKGPLADMFSGNALMQALTGTPAPAAGRKRSSEEVEGHGPDSEERRVRIRQGDEELGRAQGIDLGDDDTMILPGSEVSSPLKNATLKLSVYRQSRWVDTRSHPSKILHSSHGIEPRHYEGRAKGRLLVVRALQAASAASQPAEVVKAPSRRLQDLVHSIDARVGSPVLALSLAGARNATAISKYPSLTTTSSLEVHQLLSQATTSNSTDQQQTLTHRLLPSPSG